MNERNRKVLTLVVKWDMENYLYEHGFSLEEFGQSYYKMYIHEEKLEQPEHIFKYYNDSQNSINSLLEGYFYFSEPKKLNDPFECLNNREKQIINAASNKEKIIEHRENIGICSFSLTNESPILWGHYTNNYHGFCLRFDNNLIKINEDLPVKTHVSYLKKYEPANNSLREAKKQIMDAQISEDLKSAIHAHLTTVFEYSWKQYDWNYENEFRYLSFSANSFQRKFKFDKNALQEIYIDYRMRSRNRNVFNLLMFILKNKYPHVKAFEVKPHPLVVKLEFNQIEVKLEG
ncbi:DUF2971 domain-containing protein [Flavobacterium terrisoli]|uniref:DUF2971 domain-containing protein n=1 Tax=Flavobacterium terrisoli TaxID=3242195 RepID=UPI0025438DEA|nr:DUF2971 domain-containing protein [Flavobacterium buctense]